MNQKNLLEVDWSKIPAPDDDGAAAHLKGMTMPPISLVATDDTAVDLSRLTGRTVVFAYPRTGEPGKIALVDDWDMIPGARGCTPHTCAFRDLFADLKAAGAPRGFRPVDAEQCLPNRDGLSPAFAIPCVVGRETGTDPGARPADHAGSGADVNKAAGVGRG